MAVIILAAARPGPVVAVVAAVVAVAGGWAVLDVVTPPRSSHRVYVRPEVRPALVTTIEEPRPAREMTAELDALRTAVEQLREALCGVQGAQPHGGASVTPPDQPPAGDRTPAPTPPPQSPFAAIPPEEQRP